jgi:predicted RNA-binding Zn-ribbon protein involved in translation (DUF1610 family)
VLWLPVQVIDEAGTHFVCNECGAMVPKEEVARLLLEMESCETTCPHCGRVNKINGFSEVFAFRCRFCGEAVTCLDEGLLFGSRLLPGLGSH